MCVCVSPSVCVSVRVRVLLEFGGFLAVCKWVSGVCESLRECECACVSRVPSYVQESASVGGCVSAAMNEDEDEYPGRS